MPEIIVCAKSEVQKKVDEFEATHLLSLLDPDSHIYRPSRIPALASNWLLQLFDDEEDSAHPRAPKLIHAERILEWGRGIPTDGKLVVHCHAGMCRSTVAAYALWLQANGKDKITEGAEWLVAIRPHACPNLLLAQHFDDLLELNGEFVKACDKIGENSVKRVFQGL
jgi:predicted protein tyrosine phosphatase